MTASRASLKHVSTTVLDHLRSALVTGLLHTPIDRAALVGFGVRHQLESIEQALAGHRTAACLAVLDVVLAEREDRRPTPELVWTGPEAPAGTARDTAVVLRSLFEGARESVLLAGYSFDHARDVLAPLHASMLAHGVSTTFFVDIPQVTEAVDPEPYLAAFFATFLAENWPFAGPRPRLYFDKRALTPGPPWCSLHAKCVVVDGAKAFVSSANFTQRGQERNIEVGVLIEDASFASYLAGQWLGLIDAGIVGNYAPLAGCPRREHEPPGGRQDGEVSQAVIDGETLQTILMMRATGETSTDEHRYPELRKKFMASPQLKVLLPDFVQKYRDIGGFWHFIKHHLGTYAERRTFLYDAFGPLLRHLEGASLAPVDAVAAEALDLRPDFELVRAAWQKTIDRRDSDADGAITISRTLLESLLKHILDELGLPYDSKADLQPLYGIVAKELGLSPGMKDTAGKELPEGAKQVLSGCFSIVQGFAALRNQLSDAHGKGKSSMRAEARHAELAVNVSFALATFLVRTLEKKQGGLRGATAAPR